MYKCVQIIGFLCLFLSCNDSKKLVNTKGENISISKEMPSNKAIEALYGKVDINLEDGSFKLISEDEKDK